MLRVRDEVVAALRDSYAIERELGHGGAAIVLLARDIRHNRPVAVKVLRAELISSTAAGRFQREIAIAARLTHPNILPLHDSGVVGETLYYVTPYVEDGTLRDRLDREKQLPIEEAIGIARQIAAALDYAHAHGVVHRDIKPENILLVGAQAVVADFGIARALETLPPGQLTSSGLAVGTPRYMSPEQASGDADVDGRADVYALGCVLFEMLSGLPPFRASTPQAVAAQHVSTPPPSLSAERPACPPAMDAVIAKALSKTPADRYRTAGEFVTDVERALRAGSVHPPSRSRRATAIALGAAAIAVVAFAARYATRPRPEDMTFAVFPFAHRAELLPGWLDGDACARFVRDAMARWRGVKVIDDMRVRDLSSRRHIAALGDVLSAASALNVRYVTWGEVLPVRDSIEIRAATYDVTRKAEPSRTIVLRVARDDPGIERVFAAVADSLLVGGSAPGAAAGTRDLEALRLFSAGRRAIDSLDLGSAETSFRAAVARDEGYTQANLWLARIMSWRESAEPPSWGPFAERAVAVPAALTETERAHALALLHLSHGKMADACAVYKTLIARDSMDFAAWFGLGDCNARDPLVIPDPKSPTRWAFRGSFHTAVIAYRRALRILPSFHAAERGAVFSRLSDRVLPTSLTFLRRGYAVTPDTVRFGVPVSFGGDTIGFHPLPMARLAEARANAAREGQARAVSWSATVMADLAKEWVDVAPRDPNALERYALAIEGLVRVSAPRSNRESTLPDAIAWAQRARQLTSDDIQRLRLENHLVRLLVKSDSFARARLIADSALTARSHPTAAEASYLAGFAALTGHPIRAAALARQAIEDSTGYLPFRRPTSTPIRLPRRTMSDAVALLVFAAFDSPRDSVRMLYSRITQTIRQTTPSGDQADLRETMLHDSYVYAFGDLPSGERGALRSERDEVLKLTNAIAARDSAAMRALTVAVKDRMHDPPQVASRGPEGALAIARLLLAQRDTAGAIDVLDRGLAAVPVAHSVLIKVLPGAAALPRAMILRAAIARQQRDQSTFDRWARAAQALWARADPEQGRELAAVVTPQRRP